MVPIRPLLALLFVIQHVALFAQLDTIHWLPPMHARDDYGPQFLYLSTPSQQAFPISIRDGAGMLLATANISNAQPFRMDLGSTNNTKTLVPQSSLHKPLLGKGLVIDGPEPFYAYFRTHASTQRHAGDLTCKGRAALGTSFRIGHLIQAEDDMDRRSNFIGVMATEDSTQITLSDFDPATRFRVNNTETLLAAPVNAVLQKGECIVFAQYIQSGAATQPPNGFMGTLLQTSKPVAVNCGSWLGAPVVFTAHDIGIDQIVPVDLVGKEYILCKGNGSQVLEHPIVVAHYDGTAVYLNGLSNPITTLDAGEYFSVATSYYSAEGNMYIRTSEPAYLYQMVGGTSIGDDQNRTAGLIFVPPLSCGIPNTVDNIYLPNLIGTMSFDGGMMITAMRDSTVVLKVDGVVTSIGAPASVSGNPDFVTYRPLMMFSQNNLPQLVSVTAQGAVQVGLYGRNQPASFAGFFSGFTKVNKPVLELSILGDGVCPDTLLASGHFDGVQWMYEDSILQYGLDTMLVAYAPGLYRAIGYLGVCRRNEIAPDTVTALFNSPQFPFTVEEPSCYGFADGKIDFGTPFGGIPPYQFSVDGGYRFSQSSEVDTLVAGDYTLVVRDSTGCYNRPLDISIGQPDSFAVHIVPYDLPEPLYPGDIATFNGVPDRPITTAVWEPTDSLLCPDCLFYTLNAEATTWITLTVYDDKGCPAEDRILVQVRPNVYAPNVIKPESVDGNEAFTLFSKDPLKVLILKVYDRWGNMVFENRDFNTNDRSAGWDGTFREKEMGPGVFVWVAEIELLSGVQVVLHGDLTLVR